MKTKPTTGITGVFFLLSFLAACGSTKLVSSWKSPEASIHTSGKVLVVALMGNRDRNLRENMEKAIVRRLQDNGIQAGSAFEEYGPKILEGYGETEVLKKFKGKGYNAAVTIALLDKSKEKQYVPGSYPRFWGYYGMMYGRMYEPGYYSVSNKFLIEANFYDLDANQLIYSVQTKSINPSSPQSLASEFSDKIFTDITKKGVLK